MGSTDNFDSYVGQSVGRYQLNELVGKGAVGAVYKAFDQRLLRSVAIKISFPKPGVQSTSSDRFVREAQIIARVEHANIVPIYDVFEHDGLTLIVMRLLRGQNLEQLIQQFSRPFAEDEAFRFLQQVMLGMEFAHRKGVVHADLKPGNIFVSDSDEVFILDFGLAAVLELEKPDKSRMYGTPLYMSPEQCNGQYYDARSDIYSLGLILYTLITGSHPFINASSMQQLLSFQMEKIPDRPDKINPAITEDFASCLMKVLDKDPSRRFHSCKEFIQKLGATLENVSEKENNAEDLRWNPRANMNIRAIIQLDGNNEQI